MMKIAVLITCHNRKATTLTCLEALFKNALPEGYFLEVFLVDDGSTDGTEQAVCENYPKVNIIKGDGNLYWNGGMRVAFAAAMAQDFDYYLWLNDDTLLYPSALKTLLETEQQLVFEQKHWTLIVGSTQDKPNGKTTYGGELRFSKWRPITCQLINPSDVPVSCDTMNGNCVLIPRAIVQVLGNLDEGFVHSMGDIDYGFRAKMKGFQIMVMPGYAGLCSQNPIDNTFVDLNLSVREHFHKLIEKKMLPFKAWYVFTKRHCGLFWFVFFFWPYVKVIFKNLFK